MVPNSLVQRGRSTDLCPDPNIRSEQLGHLGHDFGGLIRRGEGKVKAAAGAVRNSSATRNPVSWRYICQPTLGSCEVTEEQPIRYRRL